MFPHIHSPGSPPSYYQFKPRAYYWIVVIIARKFGLAFVFLILRSDVQYMLAASLLVLFISFALQVINRPFMGPNETSKVRKQWGRRVEGTATSGKASLLSPVSVTSTGLSKPSAGADDCDAANCGVSVERAVSTAWV